MAKMSTDSCTKTLVTRRVTWIPEETKILISLIGKYSAHNGKLTNAETYQQVSEQMHKLGHKKTPDQCKIKWKHLKNFYYEARKKKTDQERYTICPFYKEIRNAVGSPASSIFTSRKSTAKPIKPQSRSMRTEKCFANKLYEFQQQNGKYNEPGTTQSSHAETENLPIHTLQQISNSVTVSPCSPTEHHKLMESNSKKSKCRLLDTENEQQTDQKTHSVLRQNEYDNFSFHHSITSSTISASPTEQTSPDNYRADRKTSSPSNFPRTNRFDYSPEVCIKWNSYQINMQNTLPILLDGDRFVDVTLACEGKFLKCHKLILSACSVYFDELLSQTTSQYPIIFMKDMKFWQIQAIIEFMYRGEVNIAQERLSSLLAAAEALRVKGLAAPSNHASNPIDSPKLYSSLKRHRKRRYQAITEALENKYKSENHEAVDMTKANKDKHLATANNRCSGSDEETQFFKTDDQCAFFDKDNFIEAESSCVTTIILPDHNYQQNTSCKLLECANDRCETNSPTNNFHENGFSSAIQSIEENHHDHLYSKPQKIKNQQWNQTELGDNEEDINIHDNTIFYSYLSIDDSNSSKT